MTSKRPGAGWQRGASGGHHCTVPVTCVSCDGVLKPAGAWMEMTEVPLANGLKDVLTKLAPGAKTTGLVEIVPTDGLELTTGTLMLPIPGLSCRPSCPTVSAPGVQRGGVDGQIGRTRGCASREIPRVEDEARWIDGNRAVPVGIARRGHGNRGRVHTLTLHIDGPDIGSR